MFSFLKNWLGKDRKEIQMDLREESTVEAAQLAGEAGPQAEAAPKERKKVKTELSLHPLWEHHLDAEKKYTLRFLQAELPEMIDGTVGVAGFSLIPGDKGMTVAMFFRNGSPRPVRIQHITLSILFDDKVFARHRFDLSNLDAIPPYTSRPWEVVFPPESYLHDNFMFKNWKVAISTGPRVWPKHLDLDPEMEARLTERQKERLEKIVDALPPMRPNEVKITGFDIGRTKDGNLVVGMLFRNAHDDYYQPQKLKVKITDAAGDVVVAGTVDTGKVRVLPGTSRPWLVVFPANMVKKPDADLSKWFLEVEE
jgi:accessory Sec system S-layer assembly protein